MELTDEEKKAIKELKSCIFFWQGQLISSDNEKDKKIAKKEININKTLLNLIEKLQKEIERLENIKNICPITNTSGVKCELKEK